MKVTATKEEGLKREYKVSLPKEAVASAAETRFAEISRTVKLPGFRPGKAPLELIRQRYGASVFGEALNHAVKHAMQQVIQEKSLRPVMPPKIEVTNFEEEKGVEFSMNLEVMPEIPDVDFAKITLEKPVAEVDDKAVDEGLQRIAERRKKLKKPETPKKAEKGDILFMDFVGKKDGVAFEGGTAENFQLELGGGQLVDGFEDQLIGAKPGDTRLVKITFPENYPSTDLAGQKAEFDVTVREVMETEIPAVDDAFAKEVGLESLDALKAEIKKLMENEYSSLTRNKMKRALFDKLDEAYDFQLPESMVGNEFAMIWQRVEQAKLQKDPAVDKSDEALKEEYKELAERRVKLGLLIAEIGRKQGIELTMQELNQALMAQARMMPGQERKVMEFYREHPERLEDLKGPLIEEKVVDFILGKASVTEKKITVEQLTAEDEEGSSAPKSKNTGKKATGKKEA